MRHLPKLDWHGVGQIVTVFGMMACIVIVVLGVGLLFEVWLGNIKLVHMK